VLELTRESQDEVMRSRDSHTADVREVHRQLDLAFGECQILDERIVELLRRLRQNPPLR
jgi:hypothetical protein